MTSDPIYLDHNATTDTPLAPVAGTEMLIRRPVAVVFDAFIDPAVTTRWTTRVS